MTKALNDHPDYFVREIQDRFFKHADLQNLLQLYTYAPIFEIQTVGESYLGRPIKLIKCGNGKTRVFLWSQMHGDEATGTMALIDLLNFLSKASDHQEAAVILEQCTLYLLPMVNPDGAEVFNRRNAQMIDINRDFRAQQSPEARMLRRLRDEIQPDFGFNLHDQNDSWSAGNSGNPASISLLAPAFDELLSINEVRSRAMLVVADMMESLKNLAPEHIGRWSDDEFEPRAFGDNFQLLGTSTILIEAGGLTGDPEKQTVRKYFFRAMLAGLISIAKKTYNARSVEEYFAIPANRKLHFHILLKSCLLQNGAQTYQTDIALYSEQILNPGGRSVNYIYKTADAGDLSGYFGYRTLNCQDCKVSLPHGIRLDEPADIIVSRDKEILLAIENGRMTTPPA